MSDQHISRLNFEQLRKQAKDLKRALSNGESLERLRALPRAVGLTDKQLAKAPISLALAQRVIALESGYLSWASLKHTLEARASEATLHAAILRAVLQNNHRQLRDLISRDGLVSRVQADVALALALGRLPPSLSRATVNETLPPFDWTPLLYLTESMWQTSGDLLTDDSSELADEQRRATVRALLAMGADPNVGRREDDSVRGFRTALGGAVACLQDAEMVSALLDAGALVSDGPSLWEGSAYHHAVRLKRLDIVERLLDAEPPHWHNCHALPQCFEWNDMGWVDRLLAAGADPNWTMGRRSHSGNGLAEALMWNCDIGIIERLLDARANPNFRDRDGLTPLNVAWRLARTDAIESLRNAGGDAAISEVDRWIGSCWRNEAASVPNEIRPSDHPWLVLAARLGKTETVAALAEGLELDGWDHAGDTALHVAASVGDLSMVENLLTAGADPTRLDFQQRRPQDVVGAHVSPEGRGVLSETLSVESSDIDDKSDLIVERGTIFETACDLVVTGEYDALERLILREPWLTTWRSRRPHRATLLHYIGANGTEDWRQSTPSNAVEIVRLLLRHGADPNATCMTYRGGPDETTMGLMTSSSHPRAAGLLLPLVDALVAGGAAATGGFRALVSLYRGRQTNSLDEVAKTIEPRDATEALFECAVLGEGDFARALLNAAADVNARRPDGTTPLHHAAIEGQQDMAELLVDFGADLTVRDKRFNGTPVGWANAGGHDVLARRLDELTNEN
ncbi:MAG: ankyrin repeat domain-containing protein [Pseudomonadota bacterium]